jgi:hypothetical protein
VPLDGLTVDLAYHVRALRDFGLIELEEASV